jgi:hypothetical protein
MVEKAKTLTVKEKTEKFKSQWERDQLSVALENEEHRDRTQAISSTASWKEMFADEIHMYKKRKTHEIAHNPEEIFAQQFFNFMRKNPQYIVQMPILEINLDLGATVQPFAPSSASFAPNKEKYHVDDIKDPTSCTLMYVKGRTSRTIEVVKATMMPSGILYGRPGPAECEVVEVTMIREGCEFEDLDCPNEEERIEKLVEAKGTFILWPCKDIIVQTRSSSIVSAWSIEAGGTPTSHMSMPAHDPPTSMMTPPSQVPQDLEFQESTGKSPHAPLAQDPELQV